MAKKRLLPLLALKLFPLFKNPGISHRLLALAVLGWLSFSISLAADRFVEPGGTCGGSSPCYPTINAAISAANPGDVIHVMPGTYAENVTITKSLTLISTGGRGATTITGTPGVSNGTVFINSGVNDVNIGASGQGFTVNGFDGPSPGVEVAAIYLGGSHQNISIIDNDIVANGDGGLLSNYNASINGVLIDHNTFSGQTFTGAEPAGCGFSQQFSLLNVPRQLVTMGGGSGVTNTQNITFTNNLITGTAGGYNSTDGCEQGNTLVTIDVVGATITGNTFSGTTTRYGSSLRARGQNTSINCNTFNNAGLGNDCAHIFLGSSQPLTTGSPSPNTLAGIASLNAFPQGGSYLTPDNNNSWAIYRSLAQGNSAASAIGAGQSVVATAGTCASISDPCNCFNPRNLYSGNVLLYLFEEVTISSNPGETWVVSAQSGMLDGSGNPISIGQAMTPAATPGQYTIVFYHRPGVGYTADFDNGQGGQQTVANVCNNCANYRIPAMSEWGMIFLALLLLSLGAGTVHQGILSTGGLSFGFSQLRLSFDKAQFAKSLKISLVILPLLYGAIWMIWGSLEIQDIVLSPLAMVFVAYLIHLFRSK